MVGNNVSDRGVESKQRKSKMALNPVRLASALGLASTFMPFRGIGSALTGQMNNHQAPRMQQLSVQSVGSTEWFTARSVDHVRHMLQV